MVYRFRDGFHLKGDPEAVGKAIEAVASKRGGKATPKDVLRAARAARSPLHSYFEWDDTAAAEKYREQQAGYLLRAVVVCPDETEHFEPVRAFVTVTDETTGKDAFMHVCEAMKNETTKEEVLRRARAELHQWRTRYADLDAFSSIFAAIDTFAAA